MNYSINDTNVKEYISKVRLYFGQTEPACYVFTFGCQQNEADSEKIRGLAIDMGYKITDNPKEASLIVLNTCAVREHAESKAFSMLGRLKEYKKENPSLIIGVVGCMVGEEHNVKRLRGNFPYVSFTAEPNMLHKLPELIYNALLEERRGFIIREDVGDVVEDIPKDRISGFRAWVSVMYGCNNFCSYCIVPYVRGRERSRAAAEIIKECKELISNGIREITLLGQNVNSYKSETDFAGLLAKIAELDGDFIIRFMTSHPKDASDALIDVMSKYRGKVAPYFHLPLQSGSDRILKAMNRTYDKDRYMSLVRKLREKIPDISITSDIIVGFPGEEECDFLDTLNTVREVKFDALYAFLYSPREGTPAAKMDCQISESVKKDRLSRLLDAEEKIALALSEKYVGKTVRVLVDVIEGARASGRSETNRMVRFDADGITVGQFVKVKIEEARPYELFGKIIK